VAYRCFKRSDATSKQHRLRNIWHLSGNIGHRLGNIWHRLGNIRHKIGQVMSLSNAFRRTRRRQLRSSERQRKASARTAWVLFWCTQRSNFTLKRNRKVSGVRKNLHQVQNPHPRRCSSRSRPYISHTRRYNSHPRPYNSHTRRYNSHPGPIIHTLYGIIHTWYGIIYTPEQLVCFAVNRLVL
jgi:hypothetical protein